MFKILFKQRYYERDLFVLKKEDKFLMVYRSSGLSGSGHKNKIIPFMFLNGRITISNPVLGFINKDYYFNGKVISHEKQLENKTILFLNEIETFLEKEILEDDIFEPGPSQHGELFAYVEYINKNLLGSIKNLKPFDYSLI